MSYSLRFRLLAVIVGCAWSLSTGCSKATGHLFQAIESVKPTEALVYLYRPHATKNRTVSYSLYANDQFVTKLDDGGYFPYLASPGDIVFSIHSSSHEHQGIGGTLITREGETHFVKLMLDDRNDVFKYSNEPRLIEIPTTTALEEIRSCRLMEP
ncbi:hypothetical protein [Nitrospira sp. KM1]|uniref:hypothetical protein n=1 Tax=Nitrospira sp. KM1 TaxID=1936990 RepID=UPI001564D868|nr:hypothetical protein [Nitrospira sp. KM1]